VCAFEVLEHIGADGEALDDWYGLLRPGGMLLLTVPAGERRFGAADAHVGHHRRYESTSLRRMLEQAGFETVRLDRFGFPLGYLLEPLRHVIAARAKSGAAGAPEHAGKGGRWLQPPDWLGWATRLATAPFRVLDRVLPAGTPGTSLIALARRPVGSGTTID
jgi:Methyltransferase domain